MRASTGRSNLLFLALVFFVGTAGVAFAQTGAASITGLVTDQSGAAAPGVTVSAVNQATNVEYTGVSNQAGNYTITSLPVATYVVKAVLSGFKTVSTRPLAIEAKQIARLDFKMEIGALEDMVEVTAPAPVLHGGRGDLGEHRAVAPPQRTQCRPARAPAAGDGDLQSARLHEHR